MLHTTAQPHAPSKRNELLTIKEKKKNLDARGRTSLARHRKRLSR
jgi:hypothetical protein